MGNVDNSQVFSLLRVRSYLYFFYHTLDLKTQVQILKKIYYTNKPNHEILNPGKAFPIRELNEWNEIFRKYIIITIIIIIFLIQFSMGNFSTWSVTLDLLSFFF